MKRICHIWVLICELHIAWAFRRLRSRNSVAQHHSGGCDSRTRDSCVRKDNATRRPIGRGIPSSEVYRLEPMLSGAGNSVDASTQRFGRTLVELAI